MGATEKLLGQRATWASLHFQKAPQRDALEVGGRAEAGDRGRAKRSQAKDELISGTANREKRVHLEEVICRWVVGMCFAKNYCCQ